MLVTQTTVMDVPVSLSTIVTIRETNSYQRSFYLWNLYNATLSVQLEYSNDGGATWSLVDTAFSITAGSKEVKEVASTYGQLLRIRASGGGDDKDLYVGYSRMFDSCDGDWVSPVV